MASIYSTHSRAGRCVFCVAGLALFAWSARGQYDPDWARHFRIGAMVGLNIKADFKMSGMLQINRAPGVYDDGYVHPSQNANGYTANWGYDSPAQVTGNSLMMQETTSLTPTASTTTKADAAPLPGFDLGYGGNLWYWNRVRIGWDFGFGFLPINIAANEPTSAAVNGSVFSFGIPSGPDGPVVLPTAPYHGGSSLVGPQILDTGVLAGLINGTPAKLTGSQTLDVMLYTLRLGPSIYWDFNRYLGMSVGVGPALGIVSGDLKYNETITTATVVQNEGKISKTDLVYGWYANATLLCHLVKHGDIYISGQYMPLGNATISGQGRQGTLKLNGAAYISAGVNWPF